MHTHSVIDNLSDILVELANLQIGAYGYTITGTVAFLEPYDAGRARLDPLVDKLRHRVQDNPLQAKRADTLRSQLARSIDVFSKTISAREMQGFDQAHAHDGACGRARARPACAGRRRARSEIQSPIATVILFGLISSTLLNIFVEPSLYLRIGDAVRAGSSYEPAETQPA